MNTRVMLLAVTTTLFATAWRSDQPHARANLAASETPPAVQTVAVTHVMASTLVMPVVPGVQNTPSGLEDDATSAVWMLDDVAVPLPQDITAGQYRVVSNRGWIQSLTLTPQDLSSRGILSAPSERDVYSVSHGERRWHFIRIEVPRTASVRYSARGRN